MSPLVCNALDKNFKWGKDGAKNGRWITRAVEQVRSKGSIPSSIVSRESSRWRVMNRSTWRIQRGDAATTSNGQKQHMPGLRYAATGSQLKPRRMPPPLFPPKRTGGGRHTYTESSKRGTRAHCTFATPPVSSQHKKTKLIWSERLVFAGHA